MPSLRNFVRRPSGERWLLIKASLLLGIIVLGLASLPYNVVLTRVNRLKSRVKDARGQEIPEWRIAWAVAKAGRVIPGAKCLAQALAVKALYAMAGYQANLRIGVEKIGHQQIRAHAWVESRGEIVIGNLQDLSAFQALREGED